MMLEAEFVLELTVEISEVQELGNTHKKGNFRVIPITGGYFNGPEIKGKVVPGGADWNTLYDETMSHVFAKYYLETDDGELIAVENEGFNNLEKPMAYIRTTPKFQVKKGGKYEWLGYGVFVGTLQKSDKVKTGVEIKIYKMYRHRDGSCVLQISDSLIKDIRSKTNLSIRKIAAITGVNKDRLNEILRN